MGAPQLCLGFLSVLLLPCASVLQAHIGMKEMQMRTGDALLISSASSARASQPKQTDEQKAKPTFLETQLQEIPIQPLHKMRSASSGTPVLETGTGRHNASLYIVARTFVNEVTNYTMRTSAAEYLRSEEGVKVRNQAYLVATATMSDAPIVVPLIFGVLICLACVVCGGLPEETTEYYPYQGPAMYAAKPIPVSRQYPMKMAPSNINMGPSPPPSLPGTLPQAHMMQYRAEQVAMTRPAQRTSFVPTLPPASLAASPNASIQGGATPPQLYAPAAPAGLGLTQVVMQKLLDGDVIGLTMNDDLTLGAFADQRAARFGWAIGDRVLKINGVPVNSKMEFMTQLQQAKEANRTMGQPLIFDIQR